MTEHAMNPDEPLKENIQGMLRLFFYGTLKRGFWNLDRFCRGVLDIRETEARGRLYEMHTGIPVLQVPDGDVLAHGTLDHLADVATKARFSEQLAGIPPEPALQSATVSDWGRVYGELLTFDDRRDTCPPSTAWRESAPAAPASTDGSSCRYVLPEWHRAHGFTSVIPVSGPTCA